MLYIHPCILRHFRKLYPSVRYTLMSVVLAGLLTTSAKTALTVVANLGGESTAPMFDAVNKEVNEFTPPLTLTPLSSSATPVTADEMLPVSTPEMTPGRVEKRRCELTGMTPVFLVGDDALSRTWLEQRRADLQRLHATGLVVNVSDNAALLELQVRVPGVMLLPASGSDIARRLHLKNYPVLITADGLSQ